MKPHKKAPRKLPLLPRQSKRDKGLPTLVIDLDETLIHTFHTQSGSYFMARPGAIDSLRNLSRFYEIVIFTTGTQAYAEKILDVLDISGKAISHRLFRQHTFNSKNPKDLSKLGRDLSQTIIVDNCQENFASHPDNGLLIKSWKGDVFDHQLFGLINLLIEISNFKFSDIRQAIHILKYHVNNRDIISLDNPYAEVDFKKIAKDILFP